MDKKYDPCNLVLKSYEYDKLCKKLNEEKSKSQLEKTVTERVKLITRKSKI